MIHRALGPQSILVTDATSKAPVLQVYNWQVGVRDTSTMSGRVTNIEDLVEAQSFVYMSPEAMADQRKVTEASDVFSLAAIGYHLFASRPPAGNPTVLVVQKAGDETLTGLLRKEGLPSLELLARYGEDLLSAVASLGRHGVAHRDIKPDNIGIRSLTKRRNQLILFDFSLARAPLDNIRVGTPGYTDPFLVLRKPQRWDLAAERYSAAVTLYEMSMGLGLLPQWGDGKSDPALTEDELRIHAEKFDSSVREDLVEFFLTALHRDPKRRYDNAEEMRWAWQQVFRDAEQRKVRTPSGEEVDLSVTLDQVAPKTPIAALGLSTRARNALERANILTVRNLLEYPIGEIHLMRGVGNQTRQEIIRFVAELRERFPTIEAVRPISTVVDDPEGEPPTLEILQQRVVGARSTKKESEWRIRSVLLGVGEVFSFQFSVKERCRRPKTINPVWASQSEVADALALTRARVGQVLAADRKRWAKDPLLTALRNDLDEQIQRLGGVVTVDELVELTILMRPASDSLDTAKQRQWASAVARAAVETESSLASPRYQIRRVAGKAMVACTRDLAAYAEKLGQVADQLADSDPLLPPLRVFQELFDVNRPSLPEPTTFPPTERPPSLTHSKCLICRPVSVISPAIGMDLLDG